jgi:hypothetical protein
VKRTVACLTAAGALSLVTLGLVPAAAPASGRGVNSTSASINFVGYAQLQADKTALVTVAYQCQPSTLGPTGIVEVGLEQEGGRGTAFEPSAKCDDQKHSVTLDVSPGPFKQGTAAAVAIVRNSFSGFSVAETFAELQVK